LSDEARGLRRCNRYKASRIELVQLEGALPEEELHSSTSSREMDVLEMVHPTRSQLRMEMNVDVGGLTFNVCFTLSAEL